MRQQLGRKKHLLCEKYGKKKYLGCYTRGGWTHFTAWCWYAEFDADIVNYKTGSVFPSVRNGKFVEDKPEKVIKAPTWLIKYNKKLKKIPLL